MPGAQTRVRPGSASEPSASDEASQLELCLQRQLEEDIARIFDESIYSDIELVCGKLKILTHSCILKARTKRFYRKLDAILQLNIGRNTYDEIYSFISDAYTECNIKVQEQEIIAYLEDKLKSFDNCSKRNKEDIEELEVFLTPKCISPNTEQTFSKTISSSPSTELTKEYYALVPIDNNLLDKELIEQDVLSNAFHSIIKTQSEDLNNLKCLHFSKPTTLFLSSSHIPKTIKHSNSCDILTKCHSKDNICSEFVKVKEINTDVTASQNLKSEEIPEPNVSISISSNYVADKILDPTFSPDSLITDDPSSSSDYQSAAFTCSPGVLSAVCFPQFNVGDSVSKMENIFPSSDSGLENTGLLESLSSHKDVTLTDVSLTESTLHEFNDDVNNVQDPMCSSSTENKCQNIIKGSTPQTNSVNSIFSDKEIKILNSQQPTKLKEMINCRSSKEEKQRQNEEIVILESSSLSSETGSWESVFPPKLNAKEICDKFIFSERQFYNNGKYKGKRSNTTDKNYSDFATKSPLKSTSCFIDAASLVDEEDHTIRTQSKTDETTTNRKLSFLPNPSQPVPCSSAKLDISPNDWSESNDDSLEQIENKDPDSVLKDLSPTIFDMTPITEDSLSTNLFEKAVKSEQDDQRRVSESINLKNEGTLLSNSILIPNSSNESTVMITSTPTKFTDSEIRSVTSIKNEQDCYLQNNRLEENIFDNTVYSEGNNGENVEFRRKSDSPSSSSVITSATPHNSIMSLKSLTAKHIDSDETESDTGMVKDNYYNVRKQKKYNESSPIISGGASVEDHLPQLGSNLGSPLVRRRSENKPIVSGAYIPEIDNKENKKLPKLSSAPVWIVDMSNSSKLDSERYTPDLTVKKPEDRTCENLKSDSKHLNNGDNFNKSRSSVDSDSSEKSSHKFYIDLSSLPDPIPLPSKKDIENSNEKKNIFSMYFDLGDKSTVKEMPTRLASSLNTKKTSNTDTKSSPKPKANKNSSEYTPVPAALKSNDLICSTSTFEQYESLCNNPNLSISDIIRLPEKLPDNIVVDKEKLSTNSQKKGKQLRGVDDDRLSFMTSSSVIQEESANEQTGDLFVKLSDLDKPATLTDNSLYVYTEKVTDVRMTRSIPDNNWREHSHSGTSTIVSNKVISSFHSENALSLNRLFPHLKNEFSRSMPGSLSSRTRSPLRLGASSSPGEIDGQPSDVSEVSSMQSSMCRSVVENSTTEETSQTSSLIGNCQSRLGQDLLRMFLEEIAPDVIVEVSGRRIKAHKCILSSRCQYFAGILSGGWVESAGNVIILPPFSFNVVHFALCHIYSGVSTIPDSVSIVELATIADMLGLEGLKEAIMFTLKVKYCHHFHRPCPVCTAGVLECFPLSSVYGLDDLYLKCLKWITKYFSKVWPTKAFATLPKELLDKCYQQLIVHLTTDNFVDTVYGCGIAVASLQNSRWSESVARMCRRLVNAAAQFAAPRLMGVLRALSAVPPEAPTAAAHALQDCIAAAIDWAPPDETCRAYAFLSNIVKEIKHHNSKPDLITNGAQNKVPGQNNLLYSQATSWRLQCEGALVRAAPRAVSTQAFKELPTDLRKRLRELGCIMYGTQAISVTSFPVQEKKSRSSHSRNRVHQDSRSLGIDHVRASFVPYAPKPAVTVSTSDIIRSKNDIHDCKKMSKTCPPKVRTTKAQEERAKFNLSKTNQSQERVNNKVSSSRLNSFDSAKPRYLEPKCKEVEKKTGPNKMLVPKMISSSESSRNSSPIQACKLRANRIKGRGCEAMSQDSLATSSRPRTAEPSTDSLSESQTSNNKYATYTKIKHTTRGSVESIASSKYQNNVGAGLYRTKIPIKLNQGSKPNNGLKHNSDQKRPVSLPNQSRPSALTISSRNRTTSERKLPGSLMNATKSSSAKMVPKVVKESQKPAKQSIKVKQSRQVERDNPPEIPIMERSGTFLKDEPTFGDKTTNIDID